MSWLTSFKVGDNVYAEFEIYNAFSCSVTISGSGYMYDDISDFQLISSGTIYTDWPWHTGRLIGDIVIPDGVKSIASRMFENQNNNGDLDTLYIGSSVEFIGDNAFYSLLGKGLKRIENSSNVLTTLGAGCFKNNKNLTYANFRGTVTTLGLECFYECNNIESLNLSENLDTIPALAFYNCYKLKTFNNSNKIISIETSSNAHANGIFVNCNNIEFFTIDKNCDLGINDNYGWTKFFRVELNEGSNCNENGLQITKIYSTNPQVISYLWEYNDNRTPVFMNDIDDSTEFIFCAHKGKWIKIDGYDKNKGSIPVAHENTYKYIKLLNQGDKDGTPIFLAHNGKWYQIGY